MACEREECRWDKQLVINMVVHDGSAAVLSDGEQSVRLTDNRPGVVQRWHASASDCDHSIRLRRYTVDVYQLEWGCQRLPESNYDNDGRTEDDYGKL